MYRAQRTGEVHTGFWCGDVKKSDHLEGPGVDRRKILQPILTLRLLMSYTVYIWSS